LKRNAKRIGNGHITCGVEADLPYLTSDSDATTVTKIRMSGPTVDLGREGEGRESSTSKIRMKERGKREACTMKEELAVGEIKVVSLSIRNSLFMRKNTIEYLRKKGKAINPHHSHSDLSNPF
jgi:hypothetical protein